VSEYKLFETLTIIFDRSHKDFSALFHILIEAYKQNATKGTPMDAKHNQGWQK